MGAHTTVSAKGQVVIPKELRERLRWTVGTSLEVIETGGGVMLKPREAGRERITLEEFYHRVPPHDGSPVSLEDMDKAIQDELARRACR